MEINFWLLLFYYFEYKFVSNFRGGNRNIVKEKKRIWIWTMMHPLFPPTSLKFPRESLTSLSNAIIRASPPHLPAFFNHSKRINHPSRVARITLVPCRNFVAVLPSRRRYQTDTVSVGSNKEERQRKTEKDDTRYPFPFMIRRWIVLISRFIYKSKIA